MAKRRVGSGARKLALELAKGLRDLNSTYSAIKEWDPDEDDDDDLIEMDESATEQWMSLGRATMLLLRELGVSRRDAWLAATGMEPPEEPTPMFG